MSNRKKHLKYFLLTMLFFVCCLAAKAQPTCFSTFRLSDTCNPYYLSSEFVFVGKVISLEKQNDYQDKAVVEVETAIKGDVKGRIELYLFTNCFGRVTKDGRYVFTADSFANGNLKGLASRQWSEGFSEFLAAQELEEAKKDLERIIAQVRSVTKREK